MELTVDVGNNIASLVERLAQQIGTTADQVFPWYVQQAYLQGITTLGAILLALVTVTPVFVISMRRADFSDGNKWTPVCFVSAFALMFSLGATFISGPQQVRKIINPQFYAVSMLAEDIGRMRGGK